MVSVIYDEKNKEKLAFSDKFLLPSLAVLDPEMTTSMPPGLTASTAIDALTHAIEAYVGTGCSPVSDIFAAGAVELIFNNILQATENGKDLEARGSLLVAANLAGTAFSHSMVGCVHGMAHATGALYQVPHGIANAILLTHGMDTITCGATIAFAIGCFDNGLINEKDTDGLKLTWGNSEAIVAMAEKIGKQEGFGAVLSQGSAAAAKHIGGNATDFLTTVKGLEAPMHDPRSAHGYGLAYAVSPRGACHNASLNYSLEGGMMYLPEFDDELCEITGMSSEGKAKINIISQDFGMFFSSCAVFCNLGASILNATQAVDMVNHVTGFNYTLEELMKLGKKIWYIKRGLSNLFGGRAKDDKLPKRLMTPMATGPIEGSVPDMDLMLKEFYELRGLNNDGVLKKEILEQHGLSDLAQLLHCKI